MTSPASMNDHSKISCISISSPYYGKSYLTQSSKISQNPTNLWTLSSINPISPVSIPLLLNNSSQTSSQYVIANAFCMSHKIWPMFGKWIWIPDWLRKMGYFLTHKYGIKPQCHLLTLWILPRNNSSMLISNHATYFPLFDYGTKSCNS